MLSARFHVENGRTALFFKFPLDKLLNFCRRYARPFGSGECFAVLALHIADYVRDFIDQFFVRIHDPALAENTDTFKRGAA